MKKIMKLKIKILILALVTVVIISSYWFWSSQTSKKVITKPCMPQECYIYYCDKNLKYCDAQNAFGIISKNCRGVVIYKIRGKEVAKDEFYKKLEEKNRECENCIIAVPQPCR